MACDICGRNNCVVSFHSLDEQTRYAKVIDAFERARNMRAQVRKEIDDEISEEIERLEEEG